jgi:hypothetical protein
LLVACVASAAYAADHRDAPAVMTDPATDINDVYAWAEGGKLTVGMTVSPFVGTGAAFSDAALYVFHIGSQDDLLAPTTSASHELICRFDADQTAHCWLDDAVYVTGDADQTAGISAGGVKVFAGLRDDPFFFNLTGFKDAVAAVKAAAGGLTFDPAGCPALDMATSNALIGLLETGADDFAGANTLAIVAEIDLALVNDGGDVLSVWTSTNQIGN